MNQWADLSLKSHFPDFLIMVVIWNLFLKTATFSAIIHLCIDFISLLLHLLQQWVSLLWKNNARLALPLPDLLEIDTTQSDLVQELINSTFNKVKSKIINLIHYANFRKVIRITGLDEVVLKRIKTKYIWIYLVYNKITCQLNLPVSLDEKLPFILEDEKHCFF